VNENKESNFKEALKECNFSMSGQCSIGSSLILEYGWDSGKLDENAGFYISLKADKKNLIDNYQKEQSQTKSNLERLEIYQPEKFKTEAVAKLGADWTYTWKL